MHEEQNAGVCCNWWAENFTFRLVFYMKIIFAMQQLDCSKGLFIDVHRFQAGQQVIET